MSEFIVVQVGQCGNQIGEEFWAQAYKEISLQNEKKIPNSFFNTNKTNVEARAILIDMEDSVVSRFRSGSLRNLFKNNCIISNYPGSGNNWAEGHLFHAVNYKDQIFNVIRNTVEKCKYLQGFLLLFSVSGGTGSGLGTAIVKGLEEQYPNVERFICPVYSSGTEDVITAPYNVALSTQVLIEHSSCVIPIENKSLLNIIESQKCKKRQVHKSVFVDTTPFQEMNNIIANMLLSLTSGSRFSGDLNIDMSDICTNLIPFSQMNFLCASYSPIQLLEFGSQKWNSVLNNDDYFNEILSKNNQLINVDPFGVKSVLLAGIIGCRGNITVSEIRRFIDKIQNRCKFTSWSENTMKYGLCSVPPISMKSSAMGIFNTSSMHSFFSYHKEQFNRLFRKKAYTHHYTNINGFEDTFFIECEETISNTEYLYSNTESQETISVPRLNLI